MNSSRDRGDSSQSSQSHPPSGGAGPLDDLWSRAREVSGQALQSGALRPIETREEFVDDGGMTFVVRIVDNLRLKDADNAKRRKDPALRLGEAARPKRNPFLPYEPKLFVANVSPTHACLLNKFKVMDGHLLLVTRQFEEQTSPLSEADFTALWRCLRRGPALGFYNGGREAGASQPHKHLQVVPLPLASRGPPIPLEVLLPLAGERAPAVGRVVRVGLPFPHRFVRLPPELAVSGGSPNPASLSRKLYQRMLELLALRPDAAGRLPPYNLLATDDWILIVPRSRETCEGVSINALGFAGALLVRDAEERERLLARGPIEVLRHVSS